MSVKPGISPRKLQNATLEQLLALADRLSIEITEYADFAQAATDRESERRWMDKVVRRRYQLQSVEEAIEARSQ